MDNEQAIRDSNLARETEINLKAVGKQKRIPSYIRIFNVLGSGEWRKKSAFCRPYSQDDRRLREMRQKGWIDYEENIIRENGVVVYTEYRITKIHESWWPYQCKVLEPTREEMVLIGNGATSIGCTAENSP